MPARQRRARGFTLIELVVALFITAVMFAIGYGALDQALTGRKSVETQANRLVSVQRALRMFEQDIELLTPRPVRDAIGSNYLAPLIAGTGSSAGTQSGSSASSNGTAMSNLSLQSTALLTLTRAGWANPAGVTRSELQRVFYVLEDGKLVRYTLPVLDASGAVPAFRRELMDQVDAVTFRYMDAGHHWQDTWSRSSSTGGPLQSSMRELPVAIEVTLALKDWGSIVRVIEVAG